MTDVRDLRCAIEDLYAAYVECLDDGELEQVVDKALKDHDGQKQGSWFQTIFGRRGKTEQA